MKLFFKFKILVIWNVINIYGFLMFVFYLKIKEIVMFKKKFGNVIYIGVFIMNNLENEWD